MLLDQMSPIQSHFSHTFTCPEPKKFSCQLSQRKFGSTEIPSTFMEQMQAKCFIFHSPLFLLLVSKMWSASPGINIRLKKAEFIFLKDNIPVIFPTACFHLLCVCVYIALAAFLWETCLLWVYVCIPTVCIPTNHEALTNKTPSKHTVHTPRQAAASFFSLSIQKKEDDRHHFHLSD